MKTGDSKVITRFAPSPTGFLHIGGVRTALYNWLFARQNGGKFILRIEDTDKERSKKEFENSILEALKWLGLDYDEFYRQSERTAVYKKYIEKLIAGGFAYISNEETGESKQVIRFKNPKKKIKFNDIILGEIEFDTTELGNFVIAKSTTEPLYHLTVVIDDYEMGITHVIRGQDHISNTPRQILILEALGASRPLYAHIPLILAHDRSKLSKRHGTHTIEYRTLEYRGSGYLREALINFLALIGWHSDSGKEIFNLKELIGEFKLERVQKASAVFDTQKLDFINREHLKRMPNEGKIKEIIAHLPLEVPKDIARRISPLILERINKWGDIKKMLTGDDSIQYFWRKPEYSVEILIWKEQTPAEAKTHLKRVAELLESVENWNAESVKNAIWEYAEHNGRGEVLWPTRVALSGRKKSPDPFILASILGQKETLERINTAASIL